MEENNVQNFNLEIEPNAFQKRVMKLYGIEKIHDGVTTGDLLPIEPTPSDIGDLLRVSPINPITHIRGNYLSYISDPAVMAVASQYLQDSGVIDFFGSLDEESRLTFAPSRYDQGYAILDIYQDYLANDLNNILKAQQNGK